MKATPVAAARLVVPRGNEIDVDPRSRGAERVGKAAHPRLIYAAAFISVGTLALIAFWSGIQAGFVSTAWLFLSAATEGFPAWSFVPATDPRAWNYRPLVYASFWIEYRAFGLEPLGYHLVALAGHAMAAGLLGAIAWRFTQRRDAALTAAVLFLLSPAAHEVVFDVADLHNALSAPLIVGALLAALSRRGAIAAVLTVLAFGVDENAAIILPLALVGRGSWRGIAVATAIYVVLRLVGPGFKDEGGSCRTIECLWTGATMYAARFAPFLIGAIGVAALLRRPIERPRALIFAGAWIVVAGGLSLVMLYPYVADRFVYLPSAGIALLIGLVVAELAGRRLVIAVAVVAILAILGSASLADRGRGWAEAGSAAQHIVAETVATHPDPTGPIDVVAPATLAGRHGYISDPFVFHQGLQEALGFAYGRPVEVTVQRP